MDQLTLQESVDRMGRIKAQIANLEREYDELKTAVVAAGVDQVEGKLFKVTVSRFQKVYTDWQSIAHALRASTRMINRHSEVRDEVRVLTTVR